MPRRDPPIWHRQRPIHMRPKVPWGTVIGVALLVSVCGTLLAFSVLELWGWR